MPLNLSQFNAEDRPNWRAGQGSGGFQTHSRLSTIRSGNATQPAGWVTNPSQTAPIDGNMTQMKDTDAISISREFHRESYGSPLKHVRFRPSGTDSGPYLDGPTAYTKMGAKRKGDRLLRESNPQTIHSLLKD